MNENDQAEINPSEWDTSVGIMTMREDGIALFESRPGAHETLPAAKEVVEGYNHLGGGRRLLAVADIRRARSVDRAARQYYASDEMTAVVRALALVVDSGVSRVLGNFFLGLNKPSIPTRLFRSVDDGVTWLKGLPEEPQE